MRESLATFINWINPGFKLKPTDKRYILISPAPAIRSGICVIELSSRYFSCAVDTVKNPPTSVAKAFAEPADITVMPFQFGGKNDKPSKALGAGAMERPNGCALERRLAAKGDPHGYGLGPSLRATLSATPFFPHNRRKLTTRSLSKGLPPRPPTIFPYETD